MDCYSVVVGNIPADATEAEMVQLFSRFGAVAQFRFLTTQEDASSSSAKLRQGICDFTSPEAAEEAVKQQQSSPLTIQPISAANKALLLEASSGSSPPLPSSSSSSLSTYTLKLGRDLDATLADIKIGDKYDLLHEFKQWAKQDAEAARDMLVQRPTLAQALLKLFIEFKMCVTPPDLNASADGDEDNYQGKPVYDGQLLQSVLSLTAEDIGKLDPQQQQQIRAIRASFGKV